MTRCAVLTCGLLAMTSARSDGADPATAGAKLDVQSGRPIVDGVFVNGHGPYRFLVDTGTTLNQIDPKLARSIGLQPTFTTRLTSAAGSTSVTGSRGNQVIVGSVRGDNQSFLLARLDAAHLISHDIQGVLGQAFLSHFDYLLDMRARRLEFGARDEHGTRLPFRTVEGRPVISTSLGWLVLDSGAEWVVLFGVESPNDAFRIITVSGSRSVGTVSRSLQIAGRTVWAGEAVALPRAAEAGAEGLLPTSAFRKIYVCNSEGYVILN